MAKNKIGLQFKGFEEMIEKLDKLGGDITATTEKALLDSKELVTSQLLAATTKANYPAHGKYSTGKTRESIDTEKKVTWNGAVASVDVGFDMSISGMTSIYLIYGTPKIPKVQAIYNAIYGSATKKKVAEIQQQIFEKEVKKQMEG